MEFKNALTVCLISLFAATLVVLIAGSLDNRAAARLEPQLASIAEELRAIREQGGVMANTSGVISSDAAADGLVVYYFHGDVRCPTCEAIESQTHEVVTSDFSEQSDDGQLVWKILNYQDPASADLASTFGIHMANVVLARMKDGEIENWQRLDQVWALVGDKPAFSEFMRSRIDSMLADDSDQGGAPDLPTPGLTPPPLPASDLSEIPLPE